VRLLPLAAALLSLGVPLEDALGSNMGRAGGYSDGRDIGVVFNFPNADGPSALPMSAGVGAQYTPTAGLGAGDHLLSRRAEGPGLRPLDRGGAGRRRVGGDQRLLGGAHHRHDAEAADALLDRGQWLRHLRAASFQTPGGDIARNLASFGNLKIVAGDGTEPAEAARLVARGRGACPRRARGRRCCACKCPAAAGHSFQDTQAYKAADSCDDEWSRDPLPKLKSFLLGLGAGRAEWDGSASRPRPKSTAPASAAEARAGR
jgi:2-oxoisovalerate dehydrogenase E1 component